MIDRDGFERPDIADEHMMEIKNTTRYVSFDGSYPFRPRNIFFRMWAAFFRIVAICFYNPFARLFYRIKIIGKEKLKPFRSKGFIMTINHVHLMDDLCVGTNIFPGRKIYFTTLSLNIKRPMIGFWLRSLGGIPIPNESISGNRKFNEDITYLLKHNKPVLYNPEGSLWFNYRDIRPFKRGAFVMAVRNDVPVIPIALTFRRRKKRNGKFKYYITYTICDPLYHEKGLSEKEASERLMAKAQKVTEKTVEDFYKNNDCGFDDNAKKKISTL